MDFSKLVKTRYSVRDYKPEMVGDGELQQVLEAARLAPTAANRQAFQLIVIRTQGREEELRRIYNRDWFVHAPLLICACSVPGGAWTREDNKNYAVVDVAIVMDHLILAATEQGLGTCWVAAFNAEAAREILGIPGDVEPIAFTPLGYAADQPKKKERKPLGDLVRYDHW